MKAEMEVDNHLLQSREMQTTMKLFKVLFFISMFSAAVLSTDVLPPQGNLLESTVKAKGFQVYSCSKLNKWTLKQAEAELYDSSFQHKIGFHYFLPRPDAGGGRATWSLSQTLSTEIPASTITGKAIANVSGGTGNIDQLLVQATSHSGHQGFSRVSYVQRIDNKGGIAPTEPCTVASKPKAVPYESSYAFWIQGESLALQGREPAVTLFGDGHQHYVYNGSAWQLMNATAYLSSVPGQEIVGEHFFLKQKDNEGGQPTWTTYQPCGSVTAKVLTNVKAQSEDSISWVDLQATSQSGDKRLLGDVKYVERRSTRGGLPPSELSVPKPRLGEKFDSSYSAIYHFYL